MILKKSYGFTFIELMIVITITFLMLTFVYLPYAHYQEKIKAKQVIREVSQGINEARNLAINGFDSDGTNKSIGLYFNKSDDEKGEMYFYAYPFTTDPTAAFPDDQYQIKEGRTFPKGTEFDGAASDISLGDLDNIFFFFEAITGEGSYYEIGGGGNSSVPIPADILTLNFSYRDSTSDVLKKSLTYDTRIYTIDF